MKTWSRGCTLLVLLIPFLVAGVSFASSAAAAALDGAWMGTLAVPGANLRVVFHFSSTPDGQLKGTVDSPDQGAAGIPIEKVTLDAGTVHCDVKVIGGTFDGTMAADGQSIAGTWKQGPGSLPLTLTPATAEASAPPKRPQEPQPPYPYTSEDVVFSNSAAQVELAGTLTRPQGKGPFPVVLLIAGSGPNTRNEEVAGHKIFLVLADALTRRGLAVLRVDKRGVGQSKGDYAKATTEDFVSDAQAAVAWLRQQPEIDARHIGLLGHSEGAVIAPAVAVRTPGVSFLVLVGAPAVRGDEILLRQAELIRETDSPHSSAFNAFQAELSRQILQAVEQEADDARASARMHEIWETYQAKLATSGLTAPEQKEIEQQGVALEPRIKQLTAPWMRHFLAYSPAPDLRKVRQPILVLYGSVDLQVPPSQNRAVMERLLKANKDHTVTEVPGVNHLMQPAKTGSPGEYLKIETTIDPKVLQLIGDWTSHHAALRAAGAG
jgi:pimeloyl-ACP methyl ester carboxylesterase